MSEILDKAKTLTKEFLDNVAADILKNPTTPDAVKVQTAKFIADVEDCGQNQVLLDGILDQFLSGPSLDMLADDAVPDAIKLMLGKLGADLQARKAAQEKPRHIVNLCFGDQRLLIDTAAPAGSGHVCDTEGWRPDIPPEVRAEFEAGRVPDAALYGRATPKVRTAASAKAERARKAKKKEATK